MATSGDSSRPTHDSNFVYDRDIELTNPVKLFHENRGRRYNFQRGYRSPRPRDLRTSLSKKEEAPVTMYNYQQFVDALTNSDVMQKVVSEAIARGMENKSANELADLRVHVNDEIKKLTEEVNVIQTALDNVQKGLRVLGALVGQGDAGAAGERAAPATVQETGAPAPKAEGVGVEIPSSPAEPPAASPAASPDLAEIAVSISETAKNLTDAALVRVVVKSLDKFTVNDVLHICQAIRPKFGGNYPSQAASNALRRFREREAPELVVLEGTYPAIYKWTNK